MKYMKNRSGVVFQLRQDLLDDPALGFKLCHLGGQEIVEEEVPLEDKLAAKAEGKESGRKGNGKKSKKSE